jgi:para-aminobenzoate synthetase/4-amino-4-deoxychorismate lyase
MNGMHSLPAEVYALVDQTPATVLLECCKTHKSQSDEKPFSRIFVAPARVYAPTTDSEVAELFEAIEHAVRAGQFATGFFSYECGECFEPKSSIPMDGNYAARPLAWFGIYEQCYRFDHATGTFPDGEPPDLAQFRADASVADRLQGESHVQVTLELTEDEYAKKIAEIHEWIRAGDVYQLNFTIPYNVSVRGSIVALYGRLRARQPVEFGAFLHWQTGRKVLSFSPELFFSLEENAGSRRITTRPMKGTAARGRTTHEDRECAEWLRNDPKNRSENVMIVDLLRNDLGRIATFGSVTAENLFAVERFPTLWQMTSTVSAELRPEVRLHDIFGALFPCGSITGAPKVRAMQLLGELEEQPRGVYTGAIGFFSKERTVFNVAIRTLELEGDRGTMRVGSGIVIDSHAAEEYGECVLKAEFLTGPSHRSGNQVAPADKFLLIETMLWDGGYPLLELHLDRLADSAEYFHFPCERTAMKNELEALAQSFGDSKARKVRLLLDEEGELHLSHEVLPAAMAARVGRARISEHRTDPADRWLFHKTTNRALYALTHASAIEAGYDDVLFLNLRGEVTEGAISNIFVEKNGRWATPPIDCGLLAGVYRRHLLETRHGVEERVLSVEDLRSADAIYLTNALRGVRRVTIDW